MHNREVSEEFFRFGMSDDVLVAIPSSSFEEHSMNYTAVFGSLGLFIYLKVISYEHIKGDFIYGNSVFSGKVLGNTGEKSLGEEKSRNPIVFGSSMFDPVVDKFDSKGQFRSPRSKGFQA